MKNIFIEEKLIPTLTFNPGLLLTAFRTTRPGLVERSLQSMTLYMSLVTKRVTFVIPASRNGGQLLNEYFIYSEDIIRSLGYFKGWRIFTMTDIAFRPRILSRTGNSRHLKVYMTFNLTPRMGHPGFTNSFFDHCRQVGKCFCHLQENMLFLVKWNPEFSS